MQDTETQTEVTSTDAEDQLTAAFKAVNNAIRVAHEAGRKVNAAFLSVRHDGAFMPQIAGYRSLPDEASAHSISVSSQ